MMIIGMSGLGEFVRERRILAGYRTQSSFADKVGKDQAWVSRLERTVDTLPPDEMGLVAKALGVSQLELIAAAGYEVETGHENEAPAVAAVRAILERREFTDREIDRLATVVRSMVEVMEGE